LPRPIVPPKGYPLEPRSLGEHVKKKRLDLGLRQVQLAERIGVTESTIWNWEHGTSPAPEHHARIREWLGDRPECEARKNSPPRRGEFQGKGPLWAARAKKEGKRLMLPPPSFIGHPGRSAGHQPALSSHPAESEEPISSSAFPDRESLSRTR